MSRISTARRLRCLSSLQAAVIAAPPPTTASRATFAAAARGISTTTPVRNDADGSGSSRSRSTKNTEWVRGKLWKGETPGSEDPYTQRVEPEEGTVSNLPDEARAAVAAAAATTPKTSTPAPPRHLENSMLVLPPNRTEAATEDDIQANDPSYTPALSVEELEHVAPVGSWWDQPGHWGEESRHRGFGHPARARESEVIEVCLRRALVEVLALRKAGLFAQWAARRWGDGGRRALDDALTVPFMVEGDKAELRGMETDIVKALTDEASFSPEMAAAVAEEEIVSAEEAREMIKGWKPAWKDYPLDRDTKFAMRKRLYQLTGTLIPDAKLAAARTIKHLQTLATVPPKKPKLAEVLGGMSEFGDLPNVRLHERKITSIDRENEVGRWKVIKEELERRGLPVSGQDEAPGAREKQWMKGWK
ncbi:hypothetical protein N3K66_004777 [Trichothecium roseum]|uniref:Uncharacterized protein n=1 Tax=Trichothecium roseum TaxID=47278 RepID=A0ACC0V3L9_9HYPO|nr:hypothetical protein N3K66_004777 [Trichothecium roseum]